MNWVLPLSLRNFLSKTILPLKLVLTQNFVSWENTSKIWFPGELLEALSPWDLNKYADSTQCHQETAFSRLSCAKTIVLTQPLSPKRNAQSSVFPRPKQMSSHPHWHWELAFSRPSCHLNYVSTQKLCPPGELLNAMSYGRKAWGSASLRPEQMSKVLPTDTKKWLYQDHLATKTIILTQSPVLWKNGLKLCLPETWTLTAEMRLPLCHW